MLSEKYSSKETQNHFVLSGVRPYFLSCSATSAGFYFVLSNGQPITEYHLSSSLFYLHTNSEGFENIIIICVKGPIPWKK